MPFLGWVNAIKAKSANQRWDVLLWGCALGLFSISALWVAIAYVEHYDREAVLRQAEAQTVNLAVALREHVHGVISNADLILQRVDDDFAHSSGPYALPGWIAQSQFLQKTLIQVGIIGPDGNMVTTSLPDQGKLNLSDREHFRVHLDPDALQPFISKPLIGRGSGKPTIQISRRIERPDGGFAGVGVVSLDPAYFNHFFASIDLGPNSLIYLTGRDGVLRARASRKGPNIAVGKDFSDNPLTRTLLSAAQGTYRARSDVDGIERIYGFSADSEYPVIVATGMAIEDIVAARSPEEYFHYVLGAVLSVVILLGIYWAIRQLSARIERERHLQQSQRLGAIGQLTAGIAHDFNNILTAIKGSVGRARTAKSEGGRSALLDIIEQAAQKGEHVVSNLLAYTRQQPLRPQPINVNEVVQNVVELLQAGLDSEWAVRCELALRLAPVMADGSQIETALLNLAINARDAMSAGGPIVFTTRLVEAGDADSPHDLAKGRYVAISVQDTGSGMPREVAAKAFDPFFTTKAQGTGLGLSQVYGMTKQLGGTATIDTRERVGTTVTLYLPVMPAQAPSQAPLRPEAARTGHANGSGGR